jgi:hypothetical protein
MKHRIDRAEVRPRAQAGKGRASHDSSFGEIHVKVLGSLELPGVTLRLIGEPLYRKELGKKGAALPLLWPPRQWSHQISF